MSVSYWVEDAIFYQIFPDRFAKSDAVPKASGLQPWGAPPTPHGYQGGDLLGVAEHLDYLADLGINAIYFNPIFRSGSNHRYAMRNCATDARASPPLMSGTILNSSAVTPARSTA